MTPFKPLVQRGPLGFMKLVETKPADDFKVFFLPLFFFLVRKPMSVNSSNGRLFEMTPSFEVLKLYMCIYFTSWF